MIATTSGFDSLAPTVAPYAGKNNHWLCRIGGPDPSRVTWIEAWERGQFTVEGGNAEIIQNLY